MPLNAYLSLIADFSMPRNKSHDVFLLEQGTELSLISQSFFQPQPSVTVTHDTALHISKTIEKTSDNTCQKVSMKEKMDCMIRKLQQKLVSEGESCLPFYYYNVLPTMHSHFSICKDDQEAESIHSVRTNCT